MPFYFPLTRYIVVLLAIQITASIRLHTLLASVHCHLRTGGKAVHIHKTQQAQRLQLDPTIRILRKQAVVARLSLAMADTIVRLVRTNGIARPPPTGLQIVHHIPQPYRCAEQELSLY
ncbi:hypothetical protein TWF106_010266 [Orbilia oligospora]|uniref:Uncharacterized protein n=1 Tax=Orbilia oligospora TaxID=2813651 RepID=A0A7C8QI65_ORBOL|nr:hypothetical protein TWF106_010266 [Orbilia oligospora]